MAGPDTFHQLVDAAAARTGASSEAVLAMLIDCWIERVRAVFTPSFAIADLTSSPLFSSTTCPRAVNASSWLSL